MLLQQSETFEQETVKEKSILVTLIGYLLQQRTCEQNLTVQECLLIIIYVYEKIQNLTFFCFADLHCSVHTRACRTSRDGSKQQTSAQLKEGRAACGRTVKGVFFFHISLYEMRHLLPSRERVHVS
jgi:ABC-type branched-subunit amino acid transport system ATPase component